MLKKLLDRITSLGGNTLYYPGCLTKFAAPDIEANYKSILENLGIDCITIPEFVCCGSPVLNAGYDEDFALLQKKNQELFRKYAVKRIITNCPSCYRIFRERFNMPVEHISQVLFRNIGKLDKRWDGEKACYHDPCHLGRHSGVYKEPRKVLEAVGLKIVERCLLQRTGPCAAVAEQDSGTTGLRCPGTSHGYGCRSAARSC
jgi:heterodisulfide reductase subunit D